MRNGAESFAQAIASPIRVVEGWIGKDEVKAEILQFIFVKAAFVVPPDVSVDPAHGEVHFSEPPGCVVRFLSVNRDIADPPAVRFDEAFGLDEHAAGTAARIVDTTLVRLQHFDQDPNDRARCIEFATSFALGAGESRLLSSSTSGPPKDIATTPWESTVARGGDGCLPRPRNAARHVKPAS